MFRCNYIGIISFLQYGVVLLKRAVLVVELRSGSVVEYMVAPNLQDKFFDLGLSDINDHIHRLEKMRKYADLHNDKRKFFTCRYSSLRTILVAGNFFFIKF